MIAGINEQVFVVSFKRKRSLLTTNSCAPDHGVRQRLSENHRIVIQRGLDKGLPARPYLRLQKEFDPRAKSFQLPPLTT